MKTKLWMLGAAVVALTSCTQSEVVEIPESRVIGFDSFVGKNSRAADPTMTTTSLAKAWVYGDYGTTTDGTYTPVDCDKSSTGVHDHLFDAYELTCNGGAYVTTNEHWVASKEYRFAAYSDGNNELTTGVSFNSTAATWGLVIDDYTAGDHDLIATTAKATANADLNNITSVGLSFKHLLARVQFVFNVTVENGLKLKVNPFKMKCIRTADCNVNYTTEGGDVVWTLPTAALGENDFYEFKTYSTTTANTGSSSTEDCIITASNIYKFECYVIPQDLTNNGTILEVPEIKIETLNANDETISVTTFKNVKLDITGHTGWERSTIYSYQGTIGTNSHPIIFHPTVGETWQDPDSANKSIDSYKVVTQASQQ